MSELTRQQLCAELQVSESTIKRLEGEGLPYTKVRARPRYDLPEVKRWLREHGCQSGKTKMVVSTSELCAAANAFTASYRKGHLRVMPKT